TQTPKYTLTASNSGGAWRFPYNGAESARIINRLLGAGAAVSLAKPEAGSVPYAIATAKPDAWARATEGVEVKPLAVAPKSGPAVALHRPRIGVYQSYDPAMD